MRINWMHLFGLTLSSFLMPQQGAYGAELTRWSFDPTTHWLTLTVPGGTSPHYFLLAQPPRIVVDLPNTQVNNVPEVTTYSGLVQSVRVGQFQPELTRIVIEFDPNTTFAPGHITIQPGDPTASADSATTAETWYIRPLLVGQGDEDSIPPGLVASQGAVPEPATLLDSPSGESAIATAELPEDLASRNLPPLEPGAVELPVDSPNALPRTIAEPTSAVTLDSEPNFEPPIANLPAPETAFLNISDVDLPPTEFPPTVDLSSEDLSSEDLPPDRSVNPRGASVSLIAFGETFGQDANAQSATVLDSGDPAKMPTEMPTARMLSLRYPRETALQVNGDIPRQEVLVVTRAVRDRAGDIVIPDGSLVIGRFEHMGGQLQFTPQALTIGDRTIPIANTTVDRLGSAIEPNQLIQMPLDGTILGASL